MTKTTTAWNVPGLLIGFYEGGEAYQAWHGRKPADGHHLGADEAALFDAVAAGKTIRPAKGGYYVRAELTPEAVEALRYWAETMAGSVADSAREGEQWARNELRAAQRVLKRMGR